MLNLVWIAFRANAACEHLVARALPGTRVQVTPLPPHGQSGFPRARDQAGDLVRFVLTDIVRGNTVPLSERSPAMVQPDHNSGIPKAHEEPSLLEDAASSQGSQAVARLIAFAESELQSSIIEPLLRRMGFRHVRDTSGPREEGKDLVALKLDEFGRSLLYAIQIKKWKPSAKAESRDSFGLLLNQLEMALEERALDPSTNEERKPDHCIFITPYPISERVRLAFADRLQRPLFRLLRIVDGPELIHLLERYCPDLLSDVDLDLQYRLHVEKAVNRIAESPLAFDAKQDLELDHIFVDLSTSNSEFDLDALAAQQYQNRDAEFTKQVYENVVHSLAEAYQHWSSRPAKTFWQNVTFMRQVEYKDKDVFKKDKLYEVNLVALMARISNRVRTYLSKMQSLGSVDTTTDVSTAIAREGITLQQDLRALRKEDSTVSDCLDRALSRPKDHAELSAITLPSMALLKIGTNLHILAGPGCGKTTLLRRFAQMTARDRSTRLLPLFVPLILVKEPTESAVIDACLRELMHRGYVKDAGLTPHKTFTVWLKEGRFRVCLDGLDEVGSKAGEMLGAIDALAQANPNSQFILSSRDTYGFSGWHRAFAVRLRPFSDEQLVSFIDKWFSAEPSARVGLWAWMAKNDDMRETARTPLIAATLCSLYDVNAGADMPSTELELYERRFELLLGRWEQAKRIPFMRPQLRKRYLHFLTSLAMHMHLNEKRYATQSEALKFASRSADKKSRRTPDEMITDCIHRGVLETEETGMISFGHLTYQEYLVGEWLATNNTVSVIWEHLLDAWWKKAFDFYAARKLDLSGVIQVGMKHYGTSATMERVCEMVKLAPLTPSELVVKFRRVRRTPPDLDRPAKRWVR
jgi:hypothetical protein